MKRLIFIVVLFFVSGCDTFFTLNALVIDAKTGAPLPGARAVLALDKGVEEPNIVEMTKSDGRVFMSMNKPSCAWATLTIEKEGYDKWSAQFRGSPRNEFATRLMPSK